MIISSYLSRHSKKLAFIVCALWTISLSAGTTGFSTQTVEKLRKKISVQTRSSLLAQGAVFDINTSLVETRGSFPVSNRDFNKFLFDQSEDRPTFQALMPGGPCPDIEFIDLRNVPGYPQLDDVSVCGSADTLSMIIFTGDPGEVSGFEFEIDLPTGIEYGGFEFAQLGGTSISISDPNPSRPVFLVDGITGDSLVIINIGIRSNCQVDKSEALFFDYNYEYIYTDTTNVLHECSGTYTITTEINSAVHVPVLNVLAPLTPPEDTIKSLATPYCQSMQISQDGLNTYVDSFTFEILNLDLSGTLQFVSANVNGQVYPMANVMYDAASMTSSFLIDGSYFPNNSLNNPADNRMNTNELVSVEICFQTDVCPLATDLPFRYNAKYGCNDEVCDDSGQNSFIRIRPSGSLDPTATAMLNATGIEICGNAGEVSITLNNPNPNTKQNEYLDVQFGFQTCDKPNLEVAGVTVGGVNLASTFYSWVGDDINIDLRNNTNPLLGLSDLDMDGFYDDLPGGSSITSEVLIEVSCGLNPEDCAVINCQDVQYYVDARTNCGNSFKDFPVPDAFDLVYGSTGVSNPTEVEFGTDSGVFGYDFDRYSNNGSPLTSVNESTVEVEFCYTFETLNIQDCPSGADNFLRIEFAGEPRFLEDLQYEPNSSSVSFNGGTSYSPVSDADVTFTKSSSTDATLIIDAGSDDLNVCYRYSMTMDSCICSPVGYLTADQQVVSNCSDCSGGCEILKACRKTTFRADPECTSCDCLVQHGIHSSQRSNFGYTDKTATTKHTKESLIAAGGAIDLTRFMPGDTLTHYDYFVIEDDAVLTDVGRWSFFWLLYDNVDFSLSIENLELSLDASNARLDKFQFSKSGAASRSDIDLSSYQDCTADSRDSYGSVWNYFKETPWDDSIGHNRFLNSSLDNRDNNGLYFYLWNYDNIVDCGGSNASLGEGNCIDALIADLNIEVGDTIHFQWTSPLIINPYRAATIINGTESAVVETARIFSEIYVYQYDPIGGNAAYCETYIGDACNTYSPLSFDIAGGIDAATRMTLDDCGGNVEHTFTIRDFPGPVGDPWFTHEYRPFMDIDKVNGMVRAPLAFCANAEVDKIGVTYDVSVDSTQNMFCSPVTGYDEPLCGVNSDQTIGNIFFNLKEQGIPALGIGLDNCDTLRLSYDLCTVCPQPIAGISEYDLFYDWSYFNTTIEEDRDQGGSRYRCNHETSASTPPYSMCDELGFAQNAYWYDLLNLDTLVVKENRLSEVFLLIDNRNPLAPVTVENMGANLLASSSPGVSEEIQEIEICNEDMTMSATGVGASVKVPVSVSLVNVYTDAGGTMPLANNLVSDDGEYKIYSISLPSDTYAANECNNIYVGTRLLFCPDPSAPFPTICVSSFSGCAPDEVKAALGPSGGCANSEVCYAYVSGEVGLQTEWFDLPDSSALCSEITFNMRVKNVKELVLLDLVPSFDLPPGIQPISGSWEVSYPGGEVAPLNWQPIGADPDVVVGNTYSYSDDAIWSSVINADGLQGVSTANVTQDSNKVAFRFRAATDCGEFLSGSKLLTETTASDPCSPDVVTSGFVESPGVIIDNANPEDYAQLLLIVEPKEANCMGVDNIFGVTAINTGEKSTSDSVLVCLTFPTDLQYTTGTIAFSSPSGFTPDAVSETMIGTKNEVCFNAPMVGPYGSFSFEFAAQMQDNAECGKLRLGTDIKSFLDMVDCTPGPPSQCGVFVQNSIAPSVSIDLNPPFVAEDLVVYRDCAANPANVSMYYEYTINHDGPDANNQSYTINFYEDLDGDRSVNSNIDNLLGSTTGTFSVTNGNSIQISGNVDVPADKSCPVLFEVIYNTVCACDRQEQFFDNITTRALAPYQEPIIMCPGSCFDVEVCDYVSVSGDSILGATGIPYVLDIDWDGLGQYTLPAPRTNTDSINYESMTDNTEGGTGTRNVLFSEGSYPDQNGYLVANYEFPVNVSAVFLGGGNIAGWGNQIGVYTNSAYCLEYSEDGISWSDSGINMTGADNGSIEENVLPQPIVAQYWRLSSCNAPSNWATSEFRLEGPPVPFSASSPVSRAGNTVTICIPDGVGIDDPWLVDFTTGTGNCQVEETIEIYGIGSPGFTMQADTVACENQCARLEVRVPNNAFANMSIAWSPAGLVENPTAFRTEACDLTSDQTFTATVTYNDGNCTEVLSVDVEVLPEGNVGISGDNLECYNVNEPPVITADLGWDIYNWYIVTPTLNYIAFSSTSNTFVPQQNATYYLNATRAGDLCPAASRTFTTPANNCEDYPDYERDGCDDAPCHNISENLFLGSGLTHESSPSENEMADQDDDNGVLFSDNNSFVPGNTMNMPIVITNNTGSDAYLRVWVDWNGDEDFTDAGEQIVDYTYDFATYNGTQTVHIPVGIPATVATGQALGIRFRLSTDNAGAADPCGTGTCAADGEVEDYLLRINCPPGNCAKTGVSIIRR